MDSSPNMEVERPRSAFELIGATFTLYRRYPWLFLVLAAGVVLPYQALEAIPTLGLVHGPAQALLSLGLSVGDLALVLPLVSALHVFAVDDVRQGRQPRIGSVGQRSLARLSIVSPAVFLSWLGVTAGFVALIVPGVVLLAGWAVVAPAASLEAKTWREALSHSNRLTDDLYWHVLGLLFLVFVITWTPFWVLIPFFGYGSTVLAPFLIRSVLDVATYSFTALATAFLYYDLVARMAAEGPGKPPPALPPRLAPTDPSDVGTAAPGSAERSSARPGQLEYEDRPAGWYVIPDKPWRMRYWAADDAGWSRRTTMTPKAVRENWRI